MALQSEFASAVLAHILQFSLAITLVAALTWFAGRRWPHFAFLVCMLALAKCMVPPLITSPAGVFTRTTSLAFAPKLGDMQSADMIRWKHAEAVVNNDDDSQTNKTSASSPIRFSGTGAAGRNISLGLIALVCWGLGAALVLAWAIRQYAILLRIVRNCSLAPEHVQALTRELQVQLGVTRRVEVLVSNDNFGPACVGILRPKLILPSVLASRWSDRLIRPIVAHELVHARRGDCIWGFLQFMAQVVWWFHPLVWWLGRRSYLLCERCCDEEVVASRQFEAAQYAESLVRVLELKNAFRSVPHCLAISPAKITSHRLERLMTRYGRFSRGTSRLSWALATVLALLLIPGMHWAQAQEDEEPQDGRAHQAKITAAVESGDWQAAIDLLEPVLEREPANASATFYLGYVLHAQGKLDQAIVYHRRASEFPQLAPNALYNWACALALQGDSDAAIEKLAKSIDLGFSYTSDLTDDPDLISLFEREDFKKLQLQANRNRATKQIARQLDFWLGRWIVTNEQGDVVGKNVITATENGRVITEKWTSSQGNTGTSFNYYHPQEQQWKQTWVDGSGGVIEYAGEFKAGKMQYQGHMVSPQGQPVHSRMTFTPSGPEKVEQLIEKSDDGKVWEVYFQGTYQRDQAVPWAAPAGGPICTEVDIADEVDSDL